jgi:hypothetical protein
MSNYKYALDEDKQLILTKNNDPLVSDSDSSESNIGEPVTEFTPALEQITEESPSIQQQNPFSIPTVQTPTSNSQFTPINSLSEMHPDLQEPEPILEPESEPIPEPESEPEISEPISEPEPIQQEANVLVISDGNGDDAGDSYDTQNLPDFLDFLGHLNETSTVAQIDAMGQSNFRGTIVQDFPLEWMIYVVSFQKEHNSEVVGHLINWMFYMLTRAQINELINPIPGSYIASLMDTFGIKFNYNNE